MVNFTRAAASGSSNLPAAYVTIGLLIAAVGITTYYAYRSSRLQRFREAVQTRVFEPINRRRTLTKDDMKRIPIVKYHEHVSPTKLDHGIEMSTRSGKQPQQGASLPSICSICTDELCEGTKVRKLICGHFFHCKCIDQWLMDHASTCPLWYVPTSLHARAASYAIALVGLT